MVGNSSPETSETQPIVEQNKPLNTPQEILTADPSAYMNAITAAQNAVAQGLPGLAEIFYKDASFLNPRKDDPKSGLLWGKLYKSGGILKYQKGKILQGLSKVIKSGKNNTKFFVPTEYDIAKAINIPEENLQLMQFAKKYNYKLPIGIEKYSGELLEKAYKKLLAQHNTYGRSVSFKTDPFKLKNASEETIKNALLEGKRADLSGRDSMFYNSWGQPIDIKANERLLYLFPSTSGWKPTKIYGYYHDKWKYPIDNIYSLHPNEKFKFKPSWTTEQSYEGVLQEPLDFSGDIKNWIRKNDPAFTYSGEERINLPIKDRKFFFDDPEYYAEFDGDRYWIGPQVMRVQTELTPKMIIKNIFKPYGNTYGVTSPDSIFAPGDKEMLKEFKPTTRGFSHKRNNPKVWEHINSDGNVIKSEKQGGKIKSVFKR